MRVIAGTSPLHYLVLIDHSAILPALFGRVVISPAMVEELQRPRTPVPVGAWASITASATPFCFCTTQKHLTVKRVRSSRA